MERLSQRELEMRMLRWRCYSKRRIELLDHMVIIAFTLPCTG